MLAICINGEHNDNRVNIKLPEGIPLIVDQSKSFRDSYIVDGYEKSNGFELHWQKKRFIPLSSIDETELLNQREKQLVNQ